MSTVICIDRGHGGGCGARYNGMVEDDLINVTAEECVRVLKSAGFTVLQTRTSNVNVSFEHRYNLSNSNNANLFVSIHYNAGGGEGFECIRSLRESAVATSVCDKIVKRLPTIGHVKRPNTIYTRAGSGGLDYYSVLRGTKCPAMILEGGFIDNIKDRSRLDTDQKLKNIGRIYAEAIIEHFGGDTGSSTDKLYHTTGSVTANTLNVRDYPSTDGKIVGQLVYGDKVNLLHPSGDWWGISYDNTKSSGVAFIHGSYVSTK